MKRFQHNDPHMTNAQFAWKAAELVGGLIALAVVGTLLATISPLIGMLIGY